MTTYSDITGRIMLAAIFLMAGISKVGAYSATQAYMVSQGVPGILLPLVIGLEIVGALLLIAGWKVRYVALALAFFSVASAFIFHFNFSDQIQSIMFMKNIAIAGGLLIIVSHGAGKLSLDARLRP